jgi:molecular chaperone DnaK (HSP70)
MSQQRDDVIMVCDAGGGTTDVNAMKVKSSPNDPLCLEQIVQVEGKG